MPFPPPFVRGTEPIDWNQILVPIETEEGIFISFPPTLIPPAAMLLVKLEITIPTVRSFQLRLVLDER